MATHSSIPAWKIPRREEPGGYSPWGPKESDTTEQLITRMHTLDVKRRGFEESPVAKGLHTG